MSNKSLPKQNVNGPLPTNMEWSSGWVTALFFAGVTEVCRWGDIRWPVLAVIFVLLVVVSSQNADGVSRALWFAKRTPKVTPDRFDTESVERASRTLIDTAALGKFEPETAELKKAIEDRKSGARAVISQYDLDQAEIVRERNATKSLASLAAYASTETDEPDCVRPFGQEVIDTLKEMKAS